MPADGSINTACPGRLTLKITSDTAKVAPTRRAIENFASQGGFDEVAVHQIGLVVNEALANVIRHAYGGVNDQPIVVTAECRRAAGAAADSHVRQICVTIRDWGKGNVPADRTKPRDPLMPGGIGMICMKQMMDRVEFVPQPDGMLLVMEKNQSVASP
jgi:serine/threonine-protein kinase RsbW